MQANLQHSRASFALSRTNISSSGNFSTSSGKTRSRVSQHSSSNHSLIHHSSCLPSSSSRSTSNLSSSTASCQHPSLQGSGALHPPGRQFPGSNPRPRPHSTTGRQDPRDTSARAARAVTAWATQGVSTTLTLVSSRRTRATRSSLVYLY